MLKINIGGFIGTREYLTLYMRRRINRCRYNRAGLYLVRISNHEVTDYAIFRISCYFVSLRSICLPQNPIIGNLQPSFFH